MAEQLGCDHSRDSAVFLDSAAFANITVLASFCSRVVLMCLTIRATTSRSNVFIPRFQIGSTPAAPEGGANGIQRHVARPRPDIGLTGLHVTT